MDHMEHKEQHRTAGIPPRHAPPFDRGPMPYVGNLSHTAKQNTNFRTVLWTGAHLQLTLMSLPEGGEIGLEIHPHLDQCLWVEKGRGLVLMGGARGAMRLREPVMEGYAAIIPAGTWHNVLNTGSGPLKLISIYAPPQHPRGAVHRTKAEADAAEQTNR